MRLYIRKSDCEFGSRGHPRFCPTALALRRKLKFHVRVKSETSDVLQGDTLKTAYTLTNGKKLAEQILAFDRGEDFKPGYYTLSRLS